MNRFVEKPEVRYRRTGSFRYWSRAGLPLEQETWLYLFDQPEYRQVARTEVGGVEVSTWWKGFDELGADELPGDIFETAVVNNGNPAIAHARTERQARIVHDEAVMDLCPGWSL